jgi:hypothetical protein
MRLPPSFHAAPGQLIIRFAIPAIEASGLVGWDRGADRASNDADVSTIPPNIPDCGFSPVRLKGWRFRRDLPDASISLSLLPAYADLRPVCLRPSCISWSLRWSALCRA